mgnify:CR=1 FL=1
MRKFAYMFVVFGLAVGLGVWLNQSPQTAALDQEFALPFAANAQSSDADARFGARWRQWSTVGL